MYFNIRTQWCILLCIIKVAFPNNMKYIATAAFSLFIATLLFGGAGSVYGHGFGASFEQTVDGVTVDVGYQPELISERFPIRFDFNLLEADTGEPIPFTDIWVRVYQENTTYFAGGIQKARLGLTGLTQTFPVAGEYTFSVRFQNDGEVMSETSFPVIVEKSTSKGSGSTSTLSQVVTLVVGLVVGFLLSFLFRRRNNK